MIKGKNGTKGIKRGDYFKVFDIYDGEPIIVLALEDEGEGGEEGMVKVEAYNAYTTYPQYDEEEDYWYIDGGSLGD